ncbi:MAG: Flp pilus assembly protein CpaB [Roseburia faecis]|nr:Flp pilus assembly protein CpaB [Roseburia faecis]
MDTIKVRVISIVAAAITIFCVGYYLQRVEESKPVQTNVITAAIDIPEGTEITAGMLNSTPVYEPDVIPLAVTNAEEVIGQYAAGKIAAGSQISSSILSDQKASASAASFSYKIPEGMRTVTLSISQTTAVAGMLQVGDHVDILATYTEPDGEENKTVTKYIATNVEIAALDQTVIRKDDESVDDAAGNTGTSDSQAFTTVTMFVTPELAQALVWESQNGAIVLTLRSPEEKSGVPADGFSVDTMEGLGVADMKAAGEVTSASDINTEETEDKMSKSAEAGENKDTAAVADEGTIND